MVSTPLELEDPIDFESMEHMKEHEQSGDELVLESLTTIDAVQHTVTDRLNLEENSQEAITETGMALAFIAERTIDTTSPTSPESINALEDVTIETAIETEYNIPADKTALAILKGDKYDDPLTGIVAHLHELHATLPSGHEVAPLVAKAIQELDDHPVMEGPSLQVEYLSNDSHAQAEKMARARDHIPEGIKSVTILETIDTAQLDKKKEDFNRPNGAQPTWQERVLGTSEANEIQKYTEDIRNRFETTVEQRVGDPITIEGIERRPIMDIGLGASVKAEVTATIARRQEGMNAILRTLQEKEANGESIDTAQYHAMLQERGVLGRKHSELLEGQNANPAGTLADLYIGPDDLTALDKIDSLAKTLGARVTQSSRESVERSVVQLAANSFPAGTELIHAINTDSIGHVIDYGGLATRSQRKHGADFNNSSLNGGYIHLTGPGSVATEYGNALVAGIPIETIVKKSPYMHLESSYIGNAFDGVDAQGNKVKKSLQLHLAEVELRDTSTAPDIFRAAFEATKQVTDAGMACVNIGQGQFDNYSFAASNEVANAGAYSYDIEDISLYASSKGARALFTAAERAGKTELVARRTSVAIPLDADSQTAITAEQTTSYSISEIELSSIPLSKLEIPQQGPMKFFAPASTNEVDFFESNVGNDKNKRAIAHSFETIVPDQIPSYLEGLIRDGMDPKDVLTAAFKSVNENQDDESQRRLLWSFVGGNTTFESAGVKPSDFVAGLSDEKVMSGALSQAMRNLREPFVHTDLANAPPMSWLESGVEASPKLKQELITALGDRIYALSPDTFAGDGKLWDMGNYPYTPEQRALVESYEKAKELQESTQSQVPIDGDF
jgi:hypothetical protein